MGNFCFFCYLLSWLLCFLVDVSDLFKFYNYLCHVCSGLVAVTFGSCVSDFM